MQIFLGDTEGGWGVYESHPCMRGRWTEKDGGTITGYDFSPMIDIQHDFNGLIDSVAFSQGSEGARVYTIPHPHLLRGDVLASITIEKAAI